LVPPALRLPAAFVLGAVSVLGYAPFDLFFLLPLTLAGAVALWRAEPTPARSAWSGFLFGFGLFLAGVSWVYVSLHTFGGMPAPLAALATVLFCAWLAAFPALAAWLFARLSTGSAWRDGLLAAGAWTLAEWLRGWVLTGFPWLAIGDSQSPPSPLAGLAPIVGVYGVSFALAWLAATLGLLRSARPRARAAILAAAAVLLATGWALRSVEWTEPAGEPVRVSLLQGNIEQSLKWRPELLAQSLDTYLDLARAHPARLLVLPETALPITLDDIPPGYLARLAAAAGQGSDLLLGIMVRDEKGRYFNSAIGTGAAPPQRYDKVHLVPFGEFVPPGFAWTLAILHIPMSDFSRGPDTQPPMRLAGQKVAVNICYEDVFGEQIIRALPEATLLANLSNVAWFGDSLAPPQHLQIARMRALETGRVMLRATNTGVTAAVGPRGELIGRLPAFTADALEVEVRGYTGATPFVRLGNWPAVIAAILCIAVFGRLRRAETVR
jgi:apolipoprotein N-acyltransferase